MFVNTYYLALLLWFNHLGDKLLFTVIQISYLYYYCAHILCNFWYNTLADNLVTIIKCLYVIPAIRAIIHSVSSLWWPPFLKMVGSVRIVGCAGTVGQELPAVAQALGGTWTIQSAIAVTSRETRVYRVPSVGRHIGSSHRSKWSNAICVKSKQTLNFIAFYLMFCLLICN